MKVLHCILLVLMFGFSSAGMAQKLSFSQTSVAIYQGGDPAGIVITTTPGATVRIMETSKNLKAGLGNNIFGGIVLQIIATKNTSLGSGFVKLRAEYKKKFVSGTIKVKILRKNNDPNIDLFTVDRGSAIEGESINFTISVSDFEKDQMTCFLDVDGDGKIDYTQKSCSKWKQSHLYSKTGNFKPNLIVQDSYGGKAASNNIELLKNEKNKFIAIEPPGITVIVNTEKDTQDILVGDGKCIDENQKCSLRAAIMELNSNKGVGAIKIPIGSYLLTLDGEDDTAQRGDLDIIGKIKITGEGSETTIIDANQLDRIFQVKPGSQLWISNLSLRGGKASKDGGAILVDSDSNSDIKSNLEIQNSNFENNQAGGYGGAVSSDRFSIFEGKFKNNFASVSGGALSGNGQIINSNFMENISGQQGGAIFGIDLKIKDSNFLKNQSEMGGAIYLGGNGMIENSIFRSNGARSSRSSSRSFGGGIFYLGLGESTLKISKSIFDSNVAANGAGLALNAGKILLISSIISNNISSKLGGGISSYGNQSLSIWFSEIINNSATQGGGLYIEGGNNAELLKGSFLAANTADSGPDCFGSIASSGYNLVQSPKDCRFVAAHRDSAGKVTDHSAENPQLQTMIDSYFGTLFTPSNPVLINAIPKADCTLPDGSPLETDMLGKLRLQGSGCDIGAIEVR